MAVDPTPYEGYISQNPAHQAFKREIVAAKVLFLQVRGNRDHLKADFDAKIGNLGRAGAGAFSVGMATEGSGQAQFRALNIAHNEADLIAQDYEALELQFHALLLIDLQRILESFLLDLFAEIARREPTVLMSNRTVTFEDVLETDNMVELLLDDQSTALSRSGRQGFQRQFDSLGLPIINTDSLPQEEREFLAREFNLLWGIRNLLQHNHGVVNELFLREMHATGYRAGERIAVDVAMLGRALAAVESIADDLNRRAVAQYGLP
jgi:hypothetical protein